jgi:arylsulfatase
MKRKENSQMAIKEYKLGTTFPGVIGRTLDVSKPAWPAPRRAVVHEKNAGLSR